MNAFRVTLLDTLAPLEKIRWFIAVTDKAKSGTIVADAPFVDQYTEATNNGAYLWQSTAMDVAAAKRLIFRPVMPAHTPAAYTKTTGGTYAIDVAGKNPHLSYSVTA